MLSATIEDNSNKVADENDEVISNDYSSNRESSETYSNSTFTTLSARALATTTFVLLLILLTVVGILIVHFKSPSKRVQVCPPTIIAQNKDWIDLGNQTHPIAVSDCNNDNHLDIIVGSGEKSVIDIFFGNGTGVFSTKPSVSLAIVALPYYFVVNDMNNDGFLDLIITHYKEHSIGILYGYGDGNFSIEQIISTGVRRPASFTVHDMSNDKLQDIIVTSRETNSINIWFGNINGTYEEQMTLSTGFDSSPSDVTVIDFNADGEADIIVANAGTNNIGIFFGYGNKTFSRQITYSTGKRPLSLAIGDLNNDSYLDVVVSNYYDNNINVFLGNSSGTLKIYKNYSTGSDSQPITVIMSDFNQDSQLDIIVVNSGTQNIGLRIGNLDGTFKRQRIYPIYIGIPKSVVIGDLNKDAWMDVVFTINSVRNVGVFLGGSSKNFTDTIAYSTGGRSNPASITIGDLNNDGVLDIIEANQNIDDIGVFLGYGDGTFAMKIGLPTGTESSPVSVDIGDFNNDYNLDIVTANSNAGNIGIFLGNGDGTFSAMIATSTGLSSTPYSVAAGDLDNNNQSDVVVANYRSNDISVFRKFNNQTFMNRTSYGTGSHSGPVSIALGNFNNDTWLDFVVVYYTDSGITIFLGSSAGFVRVESSLRANTHPWSVSVGDFNNDMNLDVVVANEGSGNICTFFGNGDGTLSQKNSYITGVQPRWLTVGDLNDDHYLDILVPNYGSNMLTILFGDRNGNFSKIMTRSTGLDSWPMAVTVGDFNGDEHLDIAISLSYYFVIGISLGYFNSPFMSPIFYSSGLTFTPFSITAAQFGNNSAWSVVAVSQDYPTMMIYSAFVNGVFRNTDSYSTDDISGFTSVTFGDFNNDSQNDIVLTSQETANIVLFTTFRNGTFRNPTSYETGIRSESSSISVGDFNHDHRLDVVTANSDDDSIGILLHYDFGSFSSGQIYPTGADRASRAVAFGDFNKDNLMDLVTANEKAESITVFLGDGYGNFFNYSVYSTDSYDAWCFAVAVADFNNDSNLDIAVVYRTGTYLGIFYGFGDGTFLSQDFYEVSSDSGLVSIAVGDFDKNGYIDIVVTCYSGYNMFVVLGYENNTFSEFTMYDTGYYSWPWGVAVSDFDNDDCLDITVANRYNFNIGVFLGNGNGTFKSQMTFPTGQNSEPIGIAVGDFDHDKKTDIVVANYAADNVGVFFGFGDGIFSQQLTFTTGYQSAPYGIAVGDFNKDGRLDIAVALSLSDSIAILIGQTNRSFSKPATFSTGISTYPWFLTVCDMNGDGWLDIAVVLGDISGVFILLGDEKRIFFAPIRQSTGKGSAPRSVAVADFNNDKNLDIAVTLSNNSSIGVFFGFGNGSFSNQTIYSTGNDSLSWGISVRDLNNDSQIDVIVANPNSNTFAVFLGNGNGIFKNAALYPTGELTAPTSVAILDFDRDYKLDVVVANNKGNSLTVFLGAGDGTFIYYTDYSTGYNSQPISLAVGDFNEDQWLDIAVATPNVKNIKTLLRLC